jgi:diguanylate cyclase (GGDEF)-like protein
MNYYNNTIALQLDSDTIVKKIIVNNYEDIDITIGNSAVNIISDDSLQIFYEQIASIAKEDISFGTRIKLVNNKEVFLFLVKSNQFISLFTIGVKEEVFTLFDEVIKINNDQIHMIRDLYKKISKQKEDYGFLEEIMKVNNSLIKTKRELSQKNAKLEELNRELELVNYTDYLTKISNRRKFFHDVYRFVKIEEISLIMLDFNNFKIINDKYGHIKGDEMLIMFAEKMQNYLKPYDGHLYRLGGDEFAILISTAKTPNLEELFNRINNDLEQFHEHTTVSYGSVKISTENVNDHNKVEKQMHKADIKLFDMKIEYYKKHGLTRETGKTMKLYIKSKK